MRCGSGERSAWSTCFPPSLCWVSAPQLEGKGRRMWKNELEGAGQEASLVQCLEADRANCVYHLRALCKCWLSPGEDKLPQKPASGPPHCPFPGTWQTCLTQPLATPTQHQPPGVRSFLHACLSEHLSDHWTQGTSILATMKGRPIGCSTVGDPSLHHASSHRFSSSCPTGMLHMQTPKQRTTCQSSLLPIITSANIYE